jgi:hypothetical protein
MSETTRWLRAALLLGCVLLPAGCGGSDGEKTTTTATSTAARPLTADWYEDPDGDLIPTAVEREMGTDPDVDECAKESGCPGGAVNVLERTNTLLILDSSGSMAGRAGGGTSKLTAAKSALRRFVAGTPDSLALGFMVYGHKGSNGPAGKKRSCAGVELLQPIGTAASEDFDRTLNRFKPTGYTPLAAALREARAAFSGKQGDLNRIILVTDGVETCGGDPVAQARQLKQAGIAVTTDVVGFDVAGPDEARRLRAIAEASGGTYSDARDAAALNKYFEQARQRYIERTEEYICVVGNRAKVAICQQNGGAAASNFMANASAEAAAADRTAEADEIEHLQERLDAAADRRNEEFDRQTDATTARLNREIDEAKRRYDRLAP